MIALLEACRIAIQVGLSVLLQSTVLLLAGLIAGRVLERRGAVAARAAVYKATLLGVVLGAIVSAVIAGHIRPLVTVSLPDSAPAVNQTLVSPGFTAMPLVKPQSFRASQTKVAVVPAEPAAPVTSANLAPRQYADPLNVATSPDPGIPATPMPWLYLAIGLVWAIVVMVQVSRVGDSLLALTRLWSHSPSQLEGNTYNSLVRIACELQTRKPQLRILPQLESRMRRSFRRSGPFLAIVPCPTIFVPQSLETDLDAQSIDAVLAHELTHLKNKDCEWGIVFRLICSVFWAQPLVWLLLRDWKRSSEQICDQTVLAINCPPRVYASCLLTLAERFAAAGPEVAGKMGVVPFKSDLGKRVAFILSRAGQGAAQIPVWIRRSIVLGTAVTAIGGLFLFSSAGSVHGNRDQTSRTTKIGLPVKLTTPVHPTSIIVRKKVSILADKILTKPVKGTPNMGKRAFSVLAAALSVAGNPIAFQLPAVAAPKPQAPVQPAVTPKPAPDPTLPMAITMAQIDAAATTPVQPGAPQAVASGTPLAPDSDAQPPVSSEPGSLVTVMPQSEDSPLYRITSRWADSPDRDASLPHIPVTLNLDSVPVDQAIAQLCKAANASYVSPDFGSGPDKAGPTVTVHLISIPFPAALRAVLAASRVPLIYSAEDGVIHIMHGDSANIIGSAGDFFPKPAGGSVSLPPMGQLDIIKPWSDTFSPFGNDSKSVEKLYTAINQPDFSRLTPDQQKKIKELADQIAAEVKKYANEEARLAQLQEELQKDQLPAK